MQIILAVCPEFWQHIHIIQLQAQKVKPGSIDFISQDELHTVATLEDKAVSALLLGLRRCKSFAPLYGFVW